MKQRSRSSVDRQTDRQMITLNDAASKQQRLTTTTNKQTTLRRR